MAFTEVLGPPKIAYPGDAEFVDNIYKSNSAGSDWSAGDFLRITANTGQVEITTQDDTDESGGISCYAIEDFDASEDGSIYVPVVKIATDTIFVQQVYSGTPSQTDVGTLSTLNLTTGKMAPTLTATKGVVTIVDIALNKKWFMADEDVCGAYGLVYFKINSSIITASRDNAST